MTDAPERIWLGRDDRYEHHPWIALTSEYDDGDVAEYIRADMIETELAKLSDQTAVHLNILRGTIAKPTLAQIAHLYPEVRAQAMEVYSPDEKQFEPASRLPRSPHYNFPDRPMPDRPTLDQILRAITSLQCAAHTLTEHARDLAADPGAVLDSIDDTPKTISDALATAMDALDPADTTDAHAQMRGALARFLEGANADPGNQRDATEYIRADVTPAQLVTRYPEVRALVEAAKEMVEACQTTDIRRGDAALSRTAAALSPFGDAELDTQGRAQAVEQEEC